MVAPIVIAHRGASGYRPEHTLEAYALAIAQGADYIEPDLVITRDGVLVARHENEIGGTTDVAGKFPDRMTVRTIDGQRVEGWFTEDFTLAELRTLRARERLPFRSPAFDGQSLVPTFDEVIALAQRGSNETGRPVGIYPETKHPSYFRGIGLPLEPPLLEALRRHGWDHADAPVFIQSFEVRNLRALARMTPVPLVQLIDAEGRPWDSTVGRTAATYADMVRLEGLRDIAAYARAVGVHKSLVVPRDAGGRSLPPTTLVRDAHAAGLLVHVFTLRAENEFLPAEWRIGADPSATGDMAGEVALFLRAGVDGFFTDHPATGVAARDARRR